MALISPLVEHVFYPNDQVILLAPSNINVRHLWLDSKYLPNEPPWFRISAHSWKGINDSYWGDIVWGIIPKASKSHQSYLEVSEAMAGTSKSAIYSLDWFSGTCSPETLVFTIQYRIYRGFR